MGGGLGGLGGGVGGNQFPTFDAEFKFAKIQNSHVQGGWVGWGMGVGGNQFPTFDAESKFAKKKNFTKNCLSFWAKKCLGMILDFEYQVVRVCEVYANRKNQFMKYHHLLYRNHSLKHEKKQLIRFLPTLTSVL